MSGGMTDQTLANTLLKNLLSTTATATWNPTGGTSLTILPPLHLHLFSVTGSETATGTEYPVTGVGYTSGYPSGGLTMGTSAFSLSAAVGTNANQVQWLATGTWTSAVNGVEVWDTSATAVRILWGGLTTPIAASAVTSGDTITFAASTGLSANGSAW